MGEINKCLHCQPARPEKPIFYFTLCLKLKLQREQSLNMVKLRHWNGYFLRVATLSANQSSVNSAQRGSSIHISGHVWSQNVRIEIDYLGIANYYYHNKWVRWR